MHDDDDDEDEDEDDDDDDDDDEDGFCEIVERRKCVRPYFQTRTKVFNLLYEVKLQLLISYRQMSYI